MQIVREPRALVPIVERPPASATTIHPDMLAWVLKRWAEGGMPPPSQPRIEFSGGTPQIVRDKHGLAQGGVRLPQVEVPVATNSCIPITTDFFGTLRGSNQPFGPAKLEALRRRVQVPGVLRASGGARGCSGRDAHARCRAGRCGSRGRISALVRSKLGGRLSTGASAFRSACFGPLRQRDGP
jgi:hypothetical protein